MPLSEPEVNPSANMTRNTEADINSNRTIIVVVFIDWKP
jgi:hypothetical protein